MVVFIPVKDETPPRWNSWIKFPFIKYLLIGANVAVFFQMMQMGEEEVKGFIYRYGFIPHNLQLLLELSLESIPAKLFSIFSCMFLHASTAHLAGNMLFLHIFGDKLEARLGHIPFLIFYLLGGVVATFAHALPDIDSLLPLVGASGAVSALLGAYFVCFPTARIVCLFWFFIIIRFVRIPALILLGFWFLSQLLNSIYGMVGRFDNVAWFAHVGGFVFGFFGIAFFGNRLKGVSTHRTNGRVSSRLNH